jgi:ketosteroid isomerase-like protein
MQRRASTAAHRAPGVASRVALGVALGALCVTASLGLGAALAGCGRKQAQAVATTTTPPPERESLVELRRELEAAVLENYFQLGLGNMEAYADIIDTDAAVTLIGIGPDDVFLGEQSEACTAAMASTAPEAVLQRRRACGRTSDRLPFRIGAPCLPDTDPEQPCLGVLSKNLTVRVSRDGTTAWVVDELSYRVPYRGRQAAMPLRYTAVFVRDVERWDLVQEHLSYPLPTRLTRELAAAGELATPARIERQGGAPTLWEIVHEHIAVDEAGRARSKILAAARNASEDRVILLHNPRGELRGAELSTEPNLADAFGPGTQVEARDLRVYTAPGGRVAWLAANLTVATQNEGKPVLIGMRLTAVLERDDRSAWRLMQAHVSVPIRKEQLSARVFGAGLTPRGTDPIGSQEHGLW